MTWRRMGSTVLLLLSTLVEGPRQARADYLFTTLDSQEPFPRAINNLGSITGIDQTGDGFLLSGGQVSPIRAPAATISQPYGINDAGQVVGRFLSARQTHGFLYSGDSYTRLDVSGTTTGTLANGINSSGQVVGAYGPNGLFRGFLFSGGSYTTLAVPGASSTEPFKVNDAGLIVGAYRLGGANHGFVYDGSGFTTLDVPGATATRVYAINNLGRVVGSFQDATDGLVHGFLYTGGSYTALDVPGSIMTEVWGINDAGLIVGDYQDAGFNFHGFVAAPVSEPAALVLLGVGAFGWIGWAWRSRRPFGNHQGRRTTGGLL